MDKIASELVKMAKDIYSSDADKVYKKNQKEIDYLLKRIQKGLSMHAKSQRLEELNWGYSGDLGRVLVLMKEIDEILQ